MLSVSGPRAPKLTANFGGSTRKLYRWTRPCFCFRHPKVPADRRDPSLKLNVATQYLGHLGPISARYSVCRSPRFKADKPSIRASIGRRSACLEPVGSVRRDPKLNSRRPGRTLGQTRPARQGLVRVPESNTKYGGKEGITGGDPAPVIGATISESSGIPKGKKLSRRVETGFAPLFTGQVFFQLIGLHWRDSREATEREVRYVRGTVVAAASRRRGEGRFHALPGSMTESKPAVAMRR